VSRFIKNLLKGATAHESLRTTDLDIGRRNASRRSINSKVLMHAENKHLHAGTVLRVLV